MSSGEVERYVAGWSESPPLAVCVRAWMGIKPAEATAIEQPRKVEMTQAEWDEMVAGMKANADLYGRRRN